MWSKLAYIKMKRQNVSRSHSYFFGYVYIRNLGETETFLLAFTFSGILYGASRAIVKSDRDEIERRNNGRVLPYI